ncbi:hypothetical protein [Pectobacterium brasiliense]|uniref:hypothetical protein n=1 Tax=Pectobacterium brasiliense TaxID=180957 RepID=UPI001968BF57|nr:hypothetical protein [Pectobacterium brasiliense]MBN3160184.1 hypothetical protein [Pectobacterium brasiliense]
MISYKKYLPLILLLAIQVTKADTVKITVYGGYNNCLQWNEISPHAVDSVLEIVSSAWLTGYLTAYNAVTEEDNFPGIDIATVKEFIIKHCQENPKSDVIYGIEKIKKTLSRK